MRCKPLCWIVTACLAVGAAPAPLPAPTGAKPAAAGPSELTNLIDKTFASVWADAKVRPAPPYSPLPRS